MIMFTATRVVALSRDGLEPDGLCAATPITLGKHASRCTAPVLAEREERLGRQGNKPACLRTVAAVRAALVLSDRVELYRSADVRASRWF
jgi:hypothetical protein